MEEGRLDELKRLLNEAVEEARFYEDSYGDSVVELDKAKSDMGAADQELQDIKARVEEAKNKVAEQERNARRFESQTNEAAAAKNKAVEVVRRLERRKREAEDIRDDKAKLVEEFIGEASKISEREPVPAGETGDSLDKKLSRLTDDVARAERR